MHKSFEEFVANVSNAKLVRRAFTADGQRFLPTITEESNSLRIRRSGELNSQTELNFAGHNLEEYSKHFEYTEGGIKTWYRYEIPVGEEVSGGNHGTLILECTEELKDEVVPSKLIFSTDRSFLKPAGREQLAPAGVRRVSGLDSEKQDLIEFLSNVPSDWGLAPERGLLLQGPPGTGKTQLVTEVCEERYGSIPVVISGPEILSRWVGGSERQLREKFDEARSRDAGVLYIDEIDAIARSRSGATQDHTAQLVAQLLVLLDGTERTNNSAGRPVQVIASTNIPDVLDDALTRPGRFGESIEFSPLSGSDALAVLHHYLERIRKSENGHRLSPELQQFVTKGTPTPDEGLLDGRTGAEIESMVRYAVKQTVKSPDDGSAELTSSQLSRSANSIRGEFQSRFT
ncbi:AAA family ATPase [Salinigranum halophilum]|uniref:AAA family ATPase n=1 Tax=Salinigranum halophilum TaxID=2565931 RepID=UPI0010A8A53B|nr:AAA family ATPase [Salinigranum halophilum]